MSDLQMVVIVLAAGAILEGEVWSVILGLALLVASVLWLTAGVSP